MVFALRALGASRIGFASPYVAPLNDRAIGFLAYEGFETVARAEMAEPLSNTGQGALDPDTVFGLGCKADHPDAQVIVLSCTDMRSVEVISRLETTLGKPVITSNQAMVFQTLFQLNISDFRPGFGQVFERLSK